jgi:hypothetical protein
VSDEDACGFMLAYDRLLVMKEKSKTDLENEEAGNAPTFVISTTQKSAYTPVTQSRGCYELDWGSRSGQTGCIR